MSLKLLKPSLQTQKNSLKTIDAGSWRAFKPSSTARGYGYKWQKARAGYLLKHPLCVMCGRGGIHAPATVVDHIQAHRGDMALFWDVGNWQSLCAHHHSSDAQRRDRLTNI
jgi:5-methylcytosine-specific restriction endonuclease McrA